MAPVRSAFTMLLAALFLGCPPPADEPADEPAEEEELAPVSAAEYAYRDAVNPPPPDWAGPRFELSHDYPSQDPGPCPPDVCRWLGQPVDFSSTEWAGVWEDYLRAIFDYVREGQDLSPSGWNVQVAGETRWFHVPWMAFDPKVGREFVHGMTNERTAKTSDLLGEPHGLPSVPDSDGQFETWAFGVYNPWGGYAFGRSWDAAGDPILEGNCETAPFQGCQAAGLPFAEGTLVAKLLFTTATSQDVPYLSGSPAWTANRHTRVGGCERRPQTVHLVQMDVAVVDERSPSRWVYGTYGYNGTIQAADPWDRLSPLGVQWGSDPQAFPAVADTAQRTIRESVLAPVNIYEHFGCGGRLAGPVDNKLASCMSCHANGYAHLPAGSPTIIGPADSANVPPIFGFDGICTTYNATNQSYFSNVVFPSTWSTFPDNLSMDTSLQMLVAFKSYGTFKTSGGPMMCRPTTGG